ncbi:MAG: hypothetical protein IH947_01190 [Bacteroidetes bacterium]|nr:hypothetical protein [Bacteroidota bacterium]MCH8233694.1 hypothetical protein [Bacteroidota bacterium]
MKKLKRKMENLTIPNIKSNATKEVLKITLLNSRKSAHLGVLLLLLPFLFFFGNVAKYNLGIDLDFINLFLGWIISLDTVPVVNWLIRFILLGGPILAILFNLFAIMHMYTNHETHEFIITLKLKWVNIAIIILCGLILLLFFTYLVVENMNHP